MKQLITTILLVTVSSCNDGNVSKSSSKKTDTTPFSIYFGTRSTNMGAIAGQYPQKSFVYKHASRTYVQAELSTANDPLTGCIDGLEVHDGVTTDGRYVIVSHDCTSMLSGVTNGARNLFRKDTVSKAVVRISVADDGSESDAGSIVGGISDDGRYATFATPSSNMTSMVDADGFQDIFLRDIEQGTTTLISLDMTAGLPNGYSSNPKMSSDGETIFFVSNATDLVAGDSNGVVDVFRWRKNSVPKIDRVSIKDNGDEFTANTFGFGISANAKYIAFETALPGLVAGDTNGFKDVYLKDLTTMTMERISISQAGAEPNDASYAASDAQVSISNDGRYVVFVSDATNLDATVTDGNASSDIFLRDREKGTTKLISKNSIGESSNNYSSMPKISPDGKYIVFTSAGSDLVSGDTNGATDIFLYTISTGALKRISVNPQTGAEADDLSSLLIEI